jgi:hypothetical protein
MKELKQFYKQVHKITYLKNKKWYKFAINRIKKENDTNTKEN